MLLALLGAVIIGVSLGLFGSGGSILTVPVLIYLAEMPADVAIASSLLVVAGISFFGVIAYLPKQLISWQHVWLFGIPGMLGTYGGAWLGTLVDSRWQLLTFALLMLLAALFMWRQRSTQPTHNDSINSVKVATEGLLVGLITGFVGVGGGFLIVPALVLLGRLSMPVAVGTSLCIIVIKSLAGFAKYYSVMSHEVSFDWIIIALMVALGVAGSLLGAKIGHTLPKAKLQRGFAVFLVAMGLFVMGQTVL